MILSDINNSVNWLKYASYILDNSGSNNLASCRKVFERAIKTIDITNLKEKLNIWISYINLEYTYGKSSDLKSVIDRALEVNDKKSIYKHLIRIYYQANKFDEALEIYKITLKTNFTDFDLWKEFLEFLYEAQKQGHKVSKIDGEPFTTPAEGLSKALSKLRKDKHIDVNFC